MSAVSIVKRIAHDAPTLLSARARSLTSHARFSRAVPAVPAEPYGHLLGEYDGNRASGVDVVREGPSGVRVARSLPG
jgi:hypothetical protein